MAGEMQRRVPAIGDGEQVAGELECGAALVADGHAAEAVTARARSTTPPGKTRQGCSVAQAAPSPRIDHGLDGDARIGEGLAVLQPSSQVVNTTARFPGATPKRLT